jgi:two-component sensor histidine kinase
MADSGAKQPEANPERAKPLPHIKRALGGTTTFTIVFALLLAAVPLLLFGAWLFSVEAARYQADIDALMRERTEDLATDLEGEIRQQVQIVQTLAALPALDRPDLPSFYEAARRAQALRPHWTAILLIDPGTGRQILNTLRPLGTELPAVQATAGALEAARTGQPTVWVRHPRPESLVQRPLLSIATPVMRDGQMRFLLAASIENAALREFMAARRLPDNWFASIYRDDGTIFATTQIGANVAGQAATTDFATHLQRLGAGVVKRILPGGEPVYSSFQKLAFAGLAVAVHAPVAEVERAVPDHSLLMWSAGVLALLLTLALATLMMREALRRRAESETQHLLSDTQRLLARQEMLLREVHHRVKNNLQTMASMVRIVGRKGSPESQAAFQDITRRIATLGHAYDLIHKAEDMAQLDLGVYLKSVTHQIANSFGRDEIHVTTALDSLTVDIDTALPVGLITGELVTNAYKHAFGENSPGRLTVKLRNLGEYAMLTVRDSGPGIARDPFSASAGLRIAEALASQIDGRLKAKNHPAGGAQFRLTFPLARARQKASAALSTAAHAAGG